MRTSVSVRSLGTRVTSTHREYFNRARQAVLAAGVALGRLAEIKPIVEYGIEYSALVNRLRGLIPRDVAFVQSKVAQVSVTPERQTLTLTNGQEISARLVIGANGVMADLIGARREISRCHSVSIGFDVDDANWPFDALTYFGEDPTRRVSSSISRIARRNLGGK